MRAYSLRSLLTGLSAALIAGTVFAQITAVPPAAYIPPLLPKAAVIQRLLPADVPRRVIALPAPNTAERETLKAANAAAVTDSKLGPGGTATGKGRPLAIGYGREVPATDRVIRGGDLVWQHVAGGGRAARIDVSSEGAAAIRVALAMTETHPDVSLRFAGSAPGAPVFGPYPANSIAEATGKDGMFWSPVLEGATATIELYAPAGISIRRLQFTLARISHLAVAGDSLRKLDPKLVGIGGAGSCEVDVACVTPPTAALAAAAKSVAKIVFTQEDGQSYACTGTLLNDAQASFTPYLFTASHCLNSQYAATTMNSYWFFDAVACGSLVSPPYVLLTGGAMLLGRSDDWDWALARLNSAPPEGTLFSAWRAEGLPQVGVAASTLHHPMGDLKKWSQGATQGIREFSDGSSFVQMRYNSGSTEPGSSGSGLLTFLASGGYYEVRGGLYGGDASCRNVSGSDYYSRLDNALPLLRQYLTPGAANPSSAVPTVEFYNATLRHFFLSTNPAEVNDLDTGVHSGWVRTGLRFLAYSDAALAPANASPVCRFYEKPDVGDSHFYSASPNECAETARKFGDHWIFESPNVFYIQLPDMRTGVCPANTRPVWRFFNQQTTNHRYTVEVAVRDMMFGDPSIWTAEGYGPGPYYPIMCSPLQ